MVPWFSPHRQSVKMSGERIVLKVFLSLLLHNIQNTFLIWTLVAFVPLYLAVRNKPNRSSGRSVLKSQQLGDNDIMMMSNFKILLPMWFLLKVTIGMNIMCAPLRAWRYPLIYLLSPDNAHRTKWIKLF